MCGGKGRDKHGVYHFSDLLENFIQCNITNHCYHSNKDAVSDNRVQVLSMQQRY